MSDRPNDETPTLARLARDLNARAARRFGPQTCRLPPLLLVTDTRRLPDPLAALARLPRGAAVLLRHYDDPARADLAARLRQETRARGLRLLIGADWRLAVTVDADGVHLPEALIARLPLCRAVRDGWLVTTAAHGLPGLAAAAGLGADAALLSPVFATASHPGQRALGPQRFAALVQAAAVPVYALGGIDAASATRLRASGAVGLAAIGAFAGR